MGRHRQSRAAARLAGVVLTLMLVGGATVSCQGGFIDQASQRAPYPDEDGGGQGQAENVVFIIGDGMGMAQRELIRLTTVGRDDDLVMNQLRYQGWVQTDPADANEAVTDSAAAATAFATGERSYNGAIAVDVDGNPMTTLLERAENAGKSTGVVTTAQVTDATPAAFASHVASRHDQSEIARQYLEQAGLEVILGGGEDWWYPAGVEGQWPDHPPSNPTEASKGTAGNLIEVAQRLGYQYVSDAEELEGAEADMLLGLFANEAMFEPGEGSEAIYEPAPPLPAMAAKALEVLSQDEDGFFLVIEEEGIDVMAHHGNGPLMIKAGRALDETVSLVRDFAEEHGNTLIVVVGDHETGGLAIEPLDEDGDPSVRQAGLEGPFNVAGTDVRFTIDWSTDGHTATAIPVSAEGQGAWAMVDVRDNTDIHALVLRAMDQGRPSSHSPAEN